MITRDEILAVFPNVAQTVADAIGCELEKVKLESSLIDDLGAESIDFVDILFRLQRHFKVKIPRGKIVEEARGSVSEGEFEKAGVVSEVGLERLRVFLDEVPPDRFKSPLNVADIPRLFTVETFCKLVIRQLRTTEVPVPRPAEVPVLPKQIHDRTASRL
jgi:acyl carrier protein